MTDRNRRRRGLGLVEAVVAIGILMVFAVTVIALAVGSTRSDAWGAARFVLDLRVRRPLAATATTTHEALESAGSDAAIARLSDPADDPRYQAIIAGATTNTRTSHVAGGLLLVVTEVTFRDAATGGRPATLAAARLEVDPTLSLRARYPLFR